MAVRPYRGMRVRWNRPNPLMDGNPVAAVGRVTRLTDDGAYVWIQWDFALTESEWAYRIGYFDRGWIVPEARS